jgi:endoglucanase Acf2
MASLIITTMIYLWTLTFPITISIIKSIDILVSVSKKAPDASSYPHIRHPSEPQRLNLSHEWLLHTNKFYINSLLVEGYNPIIINPFILLMNGEPSYGISVSFTE